MRDLSRLLEILGSMRETARTLVFCDTKKQVDELELELRASRFPVVALHGSKQQFERERALSAFRSGEAYIMVATDVASRGLDVKDIEWVINYDFPLQVEDYVHRIGRTARAGAKGAAYSFFTKHDFILAPELVRVLDEAGQEVPAELLDLAEVARLTSSGNIFRKWRVDPGSVVSDSLGILEETKKAQNKAMEEKLEKRNGAAEKKAEEERAKTEKTKPEAEEEKKSEPAKKPTEEETIAPKRFDNFFSGATQPDLDDGLRPVVKSAKMWGKKKA